MTMTVSDRSELAEHIREESSVTSEVRLIVYVRDNFRCRKCGEMETAKLTVHHVIFRSQGGDHSPENLVTLCWSCHKLVHDKIIAVFRRAGEWYFSDARDWRSKQ